MDPIFYTTEILDYPDAEAESLAMELSFVIQLDRDTPDAAFESVSDFEFDDEIFDNFIAEYIANESISTSWGKLINYEKEIKTVGNAISKAAGADIKLLPGTDGFTTSAPRKKDGQYYTRATLAFSDGQAVRILFYDPNDPDKKPKYPTNVVSFQIYLNKKDITSHLVKGGGQDYGPQKFGKIIGKLLERNSEKFQKKNVEIRAQKEEMGAIDKKISSLDEQIVTKSSAATQAQERNVFLKKQHADWKNKAADAVVERAATEKLEKETKTIEDAKIDTGGEVETTESRDELAAILKKEISELKAGEGTPEFKVGLRVGKRKGGLAGKVTLDIKSAGVSTLEEFNDLKGKIETIISSHTDNYSISSDKAEKQISDKEKSVDEGVLNLYPDLKGKTHQQLKDEGWNDALDNILSSYIRILRSVLFDKGFEKDEDTSWPIRKGGGELDAKFEYSGRSGGNIKDVAFIAEVAGKKTNFPADLSASPEVLAEKIDQLFVSESEEPQQEQVEDTGITQAETPSDEKPANKREIGSEYKDREGVTKFVTHEIDGDTVSAIQQKEYIFGAYLSGRKWINLPTEKKTLISEADLKAAITGSKEAYQIANDILNGNYDAQGHEKVDQLLDEIAEVIQDETILIEVADYLTKLITEKFTAAQAS